MRIATSNCIKSPEMKDSKVEFIVLSLLSALFLSAGFLFPHCGSFALIGFVPLLWMDRLATQKGIKHFWWWHYLTFVLWNAATTFWVCNATVGGGLAAIFINAAEMSVIWALFRLSKSKFFGSLPYIFLVVTWIAWERAYYSAEISWPWLTLGNAFASTTTCVQWYDETGTIGGSLWIWLCNMTVFGLSTAMAEGRWKKFNSKAKAAFATSAVLVFAGPLACSVYKYLSFEETKDYGHITACALQPNLDPYLKFEKYTQNQQDSILCRLISENEVHERGMLFVTPETVTDDVIVNDLSDSKSLGNFVDAAGDSCEVLFGASSFEFILTDKAPSYTARPYGKGVWYENHNSAILASTGFAPQIYHKSRLVIGTEKMPWPRIFSKIDDWLGGGVIARCTGQDKVGVLKLHNRTLAQDASARNASARNATIGCAVCYESVYPEYFASYVKEGAEAMSVITNDAWWGDTPGYRQHMNFSRLRAIETRRDIVRSANTGISCFINQRGDIVSHLDWDKRGSLNGQVNLNNSMTSFVQNGDICGRICTFLFLILFLALAVRLLVSIREKN